MLIADRFLALDGRTIDLASGRRVFVRTTPSGDVGEQLEWADSCAAGGQIGRDPMQGQAASGGRPRGGLLDYGLLPDGKRFEAFGECAVPGRRSSTNSPRAPEEREVGGPTREAAMVEGSLRRALDAFETASFGAPRVLRLPAGWQTRSPAILDVIVRTARLNGFVPVSMDLLLNVHRAATGLRASLAEIVETRHVLLILHGRVQCDRRGSCAPRGGIVSPCPMAVGRLVLAVGLKSARPHVLLFASDPGRPAGSRPACDCAHGQMAAGEDGGARRDCAVRPRLVRRRSPVAAEARETYRLTVVPDLVRARSRAAGAVAQAQGGGARAERGLREAMGALARRDDVAGAGWVALNLGCLLLDRGRALDAARTFDASRAHFDRAKNLAGAICAAVYVGLAWTDDSRLTQAEAAFRSARIAAQAAGLDDLHVDADIALARCLYWQGRFDEATVLAASLGDRPELSSGDSGLARSDDRPYPRTAPDSPLAVVRETQPAEAWGGEVAEPWPLRLTLGIVESDRRVRLAALSARIALARCDVRTASAQATRALETARREGKPVDVCTARTALAAVAAALKDLDGMLEHVRGGLAAAHQAHAPLRAIRLRLIACDTLRQAGREREAARVLNRLASLDASRFPALLRARVQMVLDNGRQPVTRGASPSTGNAAGADARGRRSVVAACPWRLPSRAADVNEDIVGVLQACHEIEDEERALVRVCDALRERACAVAVAVVGRSGAAPAVLAHTGPGAGRSTLAGRVLDAGVALPVAATPLGLEAASPIRYAGGVIGAIVGRWATDSLVDPARVACLLSAAGAAIAPQVRSVLDRRETAPAGIGRDSVELVGASEAVQALRKAASRAASAPFPVVIEGESGSGKELVARAIHRESPRRARRFCALNCAALTEELLEAELFGHARGAFTGAVSERVGLFEEADGGTLFLDEVADLSARAQAKLLRVLQDGEVRRVGENFARHVDARVIAATNRQLQEEVARGAFRRDLFYRLNVVHIDVPPLRERPEDIAVLAAHFWARSIARIGSRATLAPATVAALARYDWPGNVRELQNVMAALAVSAPRRGSVRPACLPGAIARADIGASTLDEARRSFERRFVRAALARAGGQRSRAAVSLGISRQGLAKLIARLGLAESADSEAD